MLGIKKESITFNEFLCVEDLARRHITNVSQGQKKIYNAITEVINKLIQLHHKGAVNFMISDKDMKGATSAKHGDYSIEYVKSLGAKLKAAVLEGEKEFSKVWENFASKHTDMFDLFSDELFSELGAKSNDTYESLFKRLGFYE
jgi:hypothetical protein